MVLPAFSDVVLFCTLMINAAAVLNFKLPVAEQHFGLVEEERGFMAKIKELLKNLRVLRVFIALWNVFVVLLMIVRQKKAEREDVSLQRIDQVKIDVHYSLRVIGFARRFIILPSSLNAVQGMQLNGDARRGRKGLNVIPVLRFLPSVVLRGVGEPKPMKSILVGAYIVQGMDFKAFQDKARQ